MIKKQINIVFLLLFVAFLPLEARAGELVWGPKKYTRDTGEPVTIEDSFIIDQPGGKFYINVKNGGSIPKPGARPGIVELVDQVSSAYIKINGVQVVGPQDFNQQASWFNKDITLEIHNIIEVEVRGKPGSYITVKIRKENLNPQVSNKKVDLRGENMKTQIVLWWSGEENASTYILSKAYSMDGPWKEWSRGYSGEPMNDVDITPEAQTRDLCYKIDALDSSNKVIRLYEPICVPKWQEEGSLSLSQDTSPNLFSSILSHGGSVGLFFNVGGQDLSSLPSYKLVSFSSATVVQLASAISTTNSTQSSSSPYNTMCLGDDEFINTSSMTYDDIKKFLQDKKSFLKEDEVMDVDGAFFDPAGIIDIAAQTYSINPQVLLTTLQKEKGAVKSPIPLPDKDLKLIMGYNTSNPSTIVDQILDAAAQMRRDFDRLSNGQATAGGWQVGVAKDSLDPLTVTPANKAVAILFNYTPWVGKNWGGRKGGNALYCQLWEQYEFGNPCPETPANIIISGPDAPSDGSQYTATGGIEPYSWSITKGSIDPNGVVTVSGQCGVGIITVADACENQSSKNVRMPSGKWALTESNVISKDFNGYGLIDPPPLLYPAMLGATNTYEGYTIQDDIKIYYYYRVFVCVDPLIQHCILPLPDGIIPFGYQPQCSGTKWGNGDVKPLCEDSYFRPPADYTVDCCVSEKYTYKWSCQ